MIKQNKTNVLHDPEFGGGKRILVAEDNEISRLVIRDQLKLLGFVTEIAEDGRQALACWEVGGYDFVLSDLHMPEMDGFGLAAAIRRREAETGRKHTILIALTAAFEEGKAKKCKAQGFDDYIAKPIPILVLKKALAKWLANADWKQDAFNSRTHEADLEKAASLHHNEHPDSPDKLPDWDPQATLELIGEDPEEISFFLRFFLENAAKELREIRDRLDAGDVNAAGVLAHNLKSSARSVGAAKFGEFCLQLERAGRGQDLEQCRALLADAHKAYSVVEWLIQAQLKIKNKIS
jgi:two-component system, sensor histidine kinase and response regulator